MKKYFKVTPGGRDNNPFVEKNPQVIVDWLKDMSVGEKVLIQALWLSEKQYKELPEYMGP